MFFNKILTNINIFFSFLILFSCGSHETIQHSQSKEIIEKPKITYEDEIFQLIREKKIEDFLIEVNNGLNINLVNKDQQSLLVQAVIWKSNEIAKILIEHGANVDLKDNFGKNALDYADDDIYLTKLLKGELESESQMQLKLYNAINDNNISEINELLNSKMNLNFLFKDEDLTPLMLTVVNKNERVLVMFLQQEQLLVNFKNKAGKTALGISREFGKSHQRITKRLELVGGL